MIDYKVLLRLEKIFDFLHKIENLKNTTRYLKTTLGRQESSAEHSWRLAMMTFIFADELKLNIDVNKSIKIALVHDLAESITGDINAILIEDGKVSKNEIKAMLKLTKDVPNELENEIMNLWNEYNNNETKEAKFIKALDKIETLLQFLEVGNKYKLFDRPDFLLKYANKHVEEFPELLDILNMIKIKLKEEFKKGGIECKDACNLT